MGGNKSIIVHYRDGLRNSERQTSQVEVPDAANNADHASIVHDSYWPRRSRPIFGSRTCNKEMIDKSLCCSTASYLKLVNGKCVDKYDFSFVWVCLHVLVNS